MPDEIGQTAERSQTAGDVAGDVATAGGEESSAGSAGLIRSHLTFEDHVESFCNTRWRWIIAGLVLLSLVQFHPWCRSSRDGVGFLSIARSMFQPGGPTNRGSGVLHLPIGYPVLMSPLFAFSDTPFLAIAIQRWFITAAALVGIYIWLRKLTPHAAAVLLTALVGCNIMFWDNYRSQLSELPFMMWLVWACLVLERALLAQGRAKTIVGWTILAAILVLAAGLTRQAGAMAVGGVALAGLVLVLRRRVTLARVIGVALATGIPVALALGLLIQHEHKAAARQPTEWTAKPRYAGYTTDLPDSPDRVRQLLPEGVRLRICDVGRLLLPGMFKVYAQKGQWRNPIMLMYVPLFLCVCVGWFRAARSTHDVLIWTLPFYFALYVVWAYESYTRYLLVILPALWLCIWFVCRPWPRYRYSILALLCIAHLIVAIGVFVKDEGHQRALHRTYWPIAEKAAEHIKQDPGPAAARGLDASSWIWLGFFLDRPVGELRPNVEVPPECKYLLVPTTAAEIPPGFEVVFTQGPARLLQRSPGG
jgi:4-amino-4-deoxy-L-arabinose transferase-like glycosyltransferase